MIKLFVASLILIFSLFYEAKGQNPKQDLSIKYDYKFRGGSTFDNMTLSIIFINKSKLKYELIVYKIEYLDKDGIVIRSNNCEWYDTLVSMTTSKIVKATYGCPADCKTIRLSIVDATVMNGLNTKKPVISVQ